MWCSVVVITPAWVHGHDFWRLWLFAGTKATNILLTLINKSYEKNFRFDGSGTRCSILPEGR